MRHVEAQHGRAESPGKAGVSRIGRSRNGLASLGRQGGLRRRKERNGTNGALWQVGLGKVGYGTLWLGQAG